jgi:hypothetical protein
MYDPHVDAGPCPFDWAGVYIVATNHKEFGEPAWKFPQGSVVIDPWRCARKQGGVEVVYVGIGESNGPASLDAAGNKAVVREPEGLMQR